MSDPTSKECFTCSTPIPSHAAYCPECIAQQLADNGGMSELEAFEAFHSFVDRINR